MFPGLGHSKSLSDDRFLGSTLHLGMVPSHWVRAWDPGCSGPVSTHFQYSPWKNYFTIPCLLSHRWIIKAPVPSQGCCAACSTSIHELLLDSCTKPAP